MGGGVRRGHAGLVQPEVPISFTAPRKAAPKMAEPKTRSVYAVIHGFLGAEARANLGGGSPLEWAWSFQPINGQGLERIRAHKYTPGVYSVCDSALNEPWNRMVEMLPRWMAPNLVTLLGLMFAATPLGVVTFVAPNLDVPLSGWMCALCALGVLAYQTLDALDGKQARRTGSSSPLGQLFDHGCDALSTTCLQVPTAACMMAGTRGVMPLLMIWVVQVPFFLAQWEEYHTGVLNIHTGGIGVTEAQFFLVFIHAVTGILGGGVWARPSPVAVPDSLGAWPVAPFLRQVGLVPGEKVDWALVVAAFTMTGSLALSACSVWRTLAHFWRTRNDPVDGARSAQPNPRDVKLSSGERMGFWSRVFLAALHLLPGFAMIFLGLHAAEPNADGTPGVFQRHTIAFLVTMGLMFTHMTNQIIIAGITAMHYRSFQKTAVALGMFVAVKALGGGGGVSLKLGGVLTEDMAFAAFAVFVAVAYGRYVRAVVLQIARHLGIHVFLIKSPGKDVGQSPVWPPNSVPAAGIAQKRRSTPLKRRTGI